MNYNSIACLFLPLEETFTQEREGESFYGLIFYVGRLVSERPAWGGGGGRGSNFSCSFHSHSLNPALPQVKAYIVFIGIIFPSFYFEFNPSRLFIYEFSLSLLKTYLSFVIIRTRVDHCAYMYNLQIREIHVQYFENKRYK
jgi:hypothetical protein